MKGWTQDELSGKCTLYSDGCVPTVVVEHDAARALARNESADVWFAYSPYVLPQFRLDATDIESAKDEAIHRVTAELRSWIDTLTTHRSKPGVHL